MASNDLTKTNELLASDEAARKQIEAAGSEDGFMNAYIAFANDKGLQVSMDELRAHYAARTEAAAADSFGFTNSCWKATVIWCC